MACYKISKNPDLVFPMDCMQMCQLFLQALRSLYTAHSHLRHDASEALDVPRAACLPWNSLHSTAVVKQGRTRNQLLISAHLFTKCLRTGVRFSEKKKNRVKQQGECFLSSHRQ